jgi:hypothetical protein
MSGARTHAPSPGLDNAEAPSVKAELMIVLLPSESDQPSVDLRRLMAIWSRIRPGRHLDQRSLAPPSEFDIAPSRRPS